MSTEPRDRSTLNARLEKAWEDYYWFLDHDGDDQVLEYHLDIVEYYLDQLALLND